MKLMKFGAEWCGPCRQLDKELDNFDLCKLVKIDVDDNEELAAEYGIAKLPTMILIDDNNTEVSRHVGYLPLISIVDWIKSIK